MDQLSRKRERWVVPEVLKQNAVAQNHGPQLLKEDERVSTPCCLLGKLTALSEDLNLRLGISMELVSKPRWWPPSKKGH